MVVFLEYLFHFNCANCNKWFSIGDWKQPSELNKELVIFCPHCRHCSVIEDITDGKNKSLINLVGDNNDTHNIS